MKKFNKKQREAIESLAYSIDEFGNKPHRLFDSLTDFAKAFVDKENANEVVVSINRAESDYYAGTEIGWMIADIIKEAKKAEDKLCSRRLYAGEKEEDFYKYCDGVAEAKGEILKIVTDILLEKV